jgi:hypothetical protein
MSKTASQNLKEIPLSIQNAQAALEALRAENPALADKVARVLPGYAKRREQQGEDVSVETLLDAARKGAGFLKGIFAAAAVPQGLVEQYKAIHQALNPPAEIAFPNPRNYPQPGYSLRSLQAPTLPALENLTEEINRVMPYFRQNALGYHYTRESPTAGDVDARMQAALRHLAVYYPALQSRDDAVVARALLQLSKEINRGPGILISAQLAHHFIKAGRIDAVVPYAVSPHGVSAQYGGITVTGGIHAVLKYLPEEADKQAALRKLLAAGIAVDPGDDKSIMDIIVELPEEETASVIGAQMAMAKDKNAARKIWHQAAGLAIVSGRSGLAGRLIPHAPRLLTEEERAALLGSILNFGDKATYKVYNKALAARPEEWLKALGRARQPVRAELLRHLMKKTPAAVTEEMISHLTAKGALDRETLTWLIGQLPERRLSVKSFNAILPHLLTGSLKKIDMLSALLDVPGIESVDQRAWATRMLKLHLSECNKLLQKLRLTTEDWDAISAGGPQSSIGLELLPALLKYGNLSQTRKNELLAKVSQAEGLRDYGIYMMLRLIENGADESAIPAAHAGPFLAYKDAIDNWQRTVRQKPQGVLWRYDPAAFKPALYADIRQILREEGYYDADTIAMAYAATALLQSEERVLQYLKKWGRPGRQPLHNLLQVCHVPSGRLAGADLHAWGDAILKHGPEMAKLAKFCLRIPRPLQSEDGSWSLVKTRAAAAQFAYARGHEHPALSALCTRVKATEQTFEKALAIVQTAVHAEKNIPAITIAGERFDLPGATFRRLPANDLRGLFLGELTDCCQSVGGAGEKCAVHGFTSAESGFYVVETAKGEVIGQAWAWRGTEGELCLDSLEKLGNRISAEQWKKLVTELAGALAARADSDVTALHVGTSGETPSSFMQAFKCAAPRARSNAPRYAMVASTPVEDAETVYTAQPRDYAGYRDSQNQYVIWRRAKPARDIKPS